MCRPLDAAELAAISAWLDHHRPTICPPCCNGALPHLAKDSLAGSIARWWATRRAAAALQAATAGKAA